ncbi:MAG: DUF3426 domain-containing protein [Rhodocyclaceae bacterium]|nr:DUF3426 domain-containing protein [Rhodocyclaceae bacterium]
MLTRCPHCQTTFRVAPEQLKARLGQVRCGTCRGVFNAIDSLADEVPVVIVPTAEAVETPPEPILETATEAAAKPEPEPASSATPEDDSPPPPAEPGDEATAVAAATETMSTVATVATVVNAEKTPVPAAWEIISEPPPPRRWPWIAGLLILLVLAAGQLLYIFRVELAVLAPELRPALLAACERLGCTLPRPQKAELIGIESSDLAPMDEGRLLLTATLKNRAPFDQEYPHLELTLTDTRDTALLKKVLAPTEYLPADHAAHATNAGFAANAEVAVRLPLEISGLPAVGYRLYLFYP